MKCLFIIGIITTCVSCSNKQPMIVPIQPKQIWIDEATHSDTIITGEGYELPNYLYYAALNWQSSADTSIANGFRKIGIRYGDSILVKPLNDLSTNYDGPFFFHIDENKTALKAQNFLDTTMSNDVRIFIPLH
jgi:hypothetical protein